MTPEQLRQWRKARQLTLQQAGELVGFKPGKSAGTSWYRLESGRKPATPMLQKLIHCMDAKREHVSQSATLADSVESAML